MIKKLSSSSYEDAKSFNKTILTIDYAIWDWSSLDDLGNNEFLNKSRKKQMSDGTTFKNQVKSSFK